MSVHGETQRRPASRVGPRFTLDELAKIARVSVARLRTWQRRSLLTRERGPRSLFGFRALARARLLARLDAEGFSPAGIERALRSARLLVADDNLALAGLVHAGFGRLHAIRLADGSLQQLGGQRIFNFAPVVNCSAVVDMRAPAEWFELGVKAENEQRLEDAIRIYRLALPECGAPAWFNLGNCHADLGNTSLAIEAFMRAVDCDSHYAAAWNNLGIAFGVLRRHSEAQVALERALEIVPHYADAHYNLADTLAVTGDIDGARKHWRSYLSFDPNSRWAEHVRQRLREGGAG